MSHFLCIILAENAELDTQETPNSALITTEKTAAELCRVLWYESRSSFFLVDKRENIKGRRGWENAWWGFSQGCLSFPALMGLTRLSDSIITKSLRYESLSFASSLCRVLHKVLKNIWKFVFECFE